jgi:hypothetical protein
LQKSSEVKVQSEEEKEKTKTSALHKLVSESHKQNMTKKKKGKGDNLVMNQQMNQEQDTSSNLNQGPLPRSHAKKLQQQVTSLLAEFDNNITENIILPKSSTLVIIRFKH